MRSRSYATLVALALTAFANGCTIQPSDAVDDSAGAIVGGEQNDDDGAAIGYLGSLSEENGQTIMTTLCTGTLIAPSVVLTAAHCFDQDHFTGEPRSLVFGTGAIGSTGVTRARAIHVHPSYVADGGTPDFTHDLAYVVLSKSLDVGPARVRRTKHRAGCDYVTTGYGVHVDGFDPQHDKVEQGDDGERRSLSICADADYASDGMIGAYSDKGSPCAGDSGGPLRASSGLEIVGVVSFTHERCVRNAHVYYTPLAANLDFIDEALGH